MITLKKLLTYMIFFLYGTHITFSSEQDRKERKAKLNE